MINEPERLNQTVQTTATSKTRCQTSSKTFGYPQEYRRPARSKGGPQESSKIPRCWTTHLVKIKTNVSIPPASDGGYKLDGSRICLNYQP